MRSSEPLCLDDAVQATSDIESLLVAESVVMPDPERADGRPCDSHVGWADTPHRHLPETTTAHRCSDVISILSEERSGSRVGFEHSLSSLLAAEVADDLRPALPNLVDYPEASRWTFDDTVPGDRENSSIAGAFPSDEASPEPVDIGGSASESESCSRPILKPLTLEDGAPDSGGLDAVEDDGASCGRATGCGV